MLSSDWNKVDFQDFIDEFDKQVIISKAPTILYSKKDKEHEAFGSLIATIFLTGILFIYIALSIILMPLYFYLIIFIVIIVILVILIIMFLINYIRTNVQIKPLENWVEIYKGLTRETYSFYCFTYYPIFSGKCHPNKAKNVLFKILQEQLLNSKLDITQIELYLKIYKDQDPKYELIGYYFQYGEGKPFKNPEINRHSWQFFHADKTNNENYISVANWDHQYEWRNDLELDYDKLHEYAPWIIKKWNAQNLKPLNQTQKNALNWELRPLESLPKLRPWEKDFSSIKYENFKAYKDLQLMNEAVVKVIGADAELMKIKDIKNYILEYKAYLRDLTS